MKRNSVDMLTGSVYKGLFAITIPVMIMNVMQTMFNVIDMTVLGKLVNDTAVGAVGASAALITLFTSLLIGISSGANIVIAKHIGTRDKENTEKAVGTAVMISITGGIILAVIGVIFAETLLRMTNCPETLLKDAVIYFRIYFLGIPIAMFYNFCASILRSVGDTKRPMIYLMFSSVIKILLNIVFISVFDMAIEGVAIATIISNTIAGGLSFIAIVRSNEMIRFNRKKMKFYGAEVKQILYVGVPTGVQAALYSLANTVIAAAVNSFGADATTGLSIANQFDGMLYQVVSAPSLAIIPYVAQNVGAKNLSRAKEAIVKSIMITIAFGASLGALSAVFSRQLSSLMSSTPAVIMYSQQKMTIISSTYFICGINEVLSGALRGVGKPIIPTVTTLIFMCALRIIWVKFIFPLFNTLSFLYLVWPIGWIICGTIATFILIPFFSKKKKHSEIKE